MNQALPIEVTAPPPRRSYHRGDTCQRVIGVKISEIKGSSGFTVSWSLRITKFSIQIECSIGVVHSSSSKFGVGELIYFKI